MTSYPNLDPNLDPNNRTVPNRSPSGTRETECQVTPDAHSSSVTWWRQAFGAKKREYFSPTCQVKVVRFFIRAHLPALIPPLPLLASSSSPALHCSGQCRTSTARKNMSEDMPERMLQNMSDRTSERMLEGMPERSFHRMLEDMSDGMSEFHEFCYPAPGSIWLPGAFLSLLLLFFFLASPVYINDLTTMLLYETGLKLDFCLS